MKTLNLIFALFFFSSIQAQFNFPDLIYIDIEDSHLGGNFGYIESKKFELINKSCIDFKDCYENEDFTTLIGKLTLDNNNIIEFHYTEGPSDDPTFIIVLNGTKILEEFGNALHFKGKNIYISGSANSYFNKKRKFSFINNKFQEVKQPFYDINEKGSLNFPITIYQNEDFTNKVASLPKGYLIEIILGKTGGDYDNLKSVLIKSEFGLLGWFNFSEVEFGKPIIDGFNFNGD